MSYSIGIVGYGVVGKNLAEFFDREDRDIICYDVDSLPEVKDQINKCKYVFVCVPTPMNADGSCNTDTVEAVCDWIDSKYIIIRSTVPPGTTKRLRAKTGKQIVFQPEYIGETADHPLVDHNNQRFIILGGYKAHCSAVADLYKDYYASDLYVHITDSTASEVAKYMENAFYALKVAFCNEFYDIADCYAVDYNELRELWLADPRISRDHTFVYPDRRGYGGKCLPKDTNAIIHAADEKGYSADLLKAVSEVNNKVKGLNREALPWKQNSK